MATINIKLTGFKELAASLRALPQNLSKNALRSAVGSGAALVRNAARQNALAMKDTGTLARSIYMKQIRELSNAEKQTWYVGARQGKKEQKVGKRGTNRDAFYARFVELGHYTRTPRNGGSPKWVPPHPFLRPAFETQKAAAIEAMADKIRQRLLKFKADGK